MKRAILAAVFVILAGVAFTVYAAETYPTGSTTVTIYPSMVGVLNDTISTDTDAAILCGVAVGPDYPTIPILKADLSSIPSGKAIVAAHVTVVASKVTSGQAWQLGTGRITAARVLAPYDTTAVTRSRRSASTWWPSDEIRNFADTTVDDEANSSTASLRIGLGTGLPDAAPAAGDEITIDVTGLVRSWYSGYWDNNGMALLFSSPEDAATSITLHSSKAALRPYLTVTYADVGGVGSAGRGRYIGERP